MLDQLSARFAISMQPPAGISNRQPPSGTLRSGQGVKKVLGWKMGSLRGGRCQLAVWVRHAAGVVGQSLPNVGTPKL